MFCLGCSLSSWQQTWRVRRGQGIVTEVMVCLIYLGLGCNGDPCTLISSSISNILFLRVSLPSLFWHSHSAHIIPHLLILSIWYSSTLLIHFSHVHTILEHHATHIHPLHNPFKVKPIWKLSYYIFMIDVPHSMSMTLMHTYNRVGAKCCFVHPPSTRSRFLLSYTYYLSALHCLLPHLSVVTWSCLLSTNSSITS